MATPLDNYLRTHRKRSGLTRGELAFLVGLKDTAPVGKHERFARMPLASTLIAYEIVLGQPARELFRGTYREVERDTIRRALELSNRLAAAAGPRAQQKRESLRAIYVPTLINNQGGNETRN